MKTEYLWDRNLQMAYGFYFNAFHLDGWTKKDLDWGKFYCNVAICLKAAKDVTNKNGFPTTVRSRNAHSACL